ncbi:MAG: hypothetical protein Q8L46_00475, partial [candidate division WWE3 bacterium]|nr:hypothetical protein [candidate division WWE3 bacterium]
TKDLMKKGLEELTKGLGRLGLKRLVAFLGKLVAKLIGTLGNTVGPGVAAAAGAILAFSTDLIVDAVGGLLKALGYLAGGLISCLILFGVGFVVLISIILANIPYPWEAGAGRLEIDCDQMATATDACVVSKEVVKGIADRWGPIVNPDENHVNECYNDVIAKLQAAGADPRVAMATWLNESNASNYELYERLGEPPQDFGIPSQAGNGFTAQITSFLNFYEQGPSTYPACYQGYGVVEGFFRTFCTAGREAYGVGTCPSLTPAGQDCVASYLGVYDMVSICPRP